MLIQGMMMVEKSKAFDRLYLDHGIEESDIAASV